MAGRLICIEGIDSSGKNTQSKLLAERLKAQLYSFPRYDTMVGKIIKRHLTGQIALREEHTIDSSDHTIDGDVVYRTAPEDPIAFQALMLADKATASVEIRNHLSVGHDVVCDRWIQSAVCYGAADGIDPLWLQAIHEAFPRADLNIFLDVAPEEALRRRPDACDRFERDREKQARVREEYQKMWASAGHRYVIVNGVGTVEVVAERIWTEVTERL